MKTSDVLLQAEQADSLEEAIRHLRSLWKLTRDGELSGVLGRLNPVSRSRR